MPYQPNPFVNPNQRGVELPEGCKDLLEALQKVGEEGARGGRELRTRRGTLPDLAGYVERLYMEPRGRYLVVVAREINGVLWVIHQKEGGFRLMFLWREQHKVLGGLISELFGEGNFHEQGNAKMKTIYAALPEMWLEATEIVDRVIRGYEASDNTPLLFDFGFFKGKKPHS